MAGMRRVALNALIIGTGSLAVLAGAAAAQEPAPTTPTTPVAPTAPGPQTIADGVKIAGVDVSGLTATAARKVVIDEHVAPRRRSAVVVFRGRRVAISPAAVGYVADVDYAIKAAMLYGRGKAVPAGGANVPLREKVDVKRLTAVLTARVAKYNVPARDAAFSLRGTKPVVREARPGVSLNVTRSVRLLSTGLVARRKNTFTLPSRRVKPAVTRLPNAIIIDRGNFRLTLWKHRGGTQTYPIAVGMPGHATPVGNFRVIEKQVNPTWFPPDSPWAAGLGPVPPGPGNPLGTRWIGTSAPAIGIHGTPVPSSIGTRASHGCIRMYIRDVERLYSQVELGTPVYIR